MKHLSGVRVGCRLVHLCRRLFFRRRRGKRLPTIHLGSSEEKRGLLGWCRRLCNSGDKRRKVAALEEKKKKQRKTKLVVAPKGHLVVYVGEVAARFVVPVVHFNHPLFAELLLEAEREFGFHHPGGITLPCQVSDFESVRTRIIAAQAPTGSAAKNHGKNSSWLL